MAVTPVEVKKSPAPRTATIPWSRTTRRTRWRRNCRPRGEGHRGEFAKGVLTVTLPKSAEAQKQQHEIDVKAA
jgi:hypothetical protein